MAIRYGVDYREETRKAARRYGLDAALFERQIGTESNFNPKAGSPAGARGIAQFMPATAAGLGINPDDPIEALDGAAKLMSNYVKKYGNYRDALVAYNAGPGRVGKSLPGETRAYLSKILGGTDPRPASKQQPSRTSPPAAPAPAVDKDAAIVDALLSKRKLGGGLLADAAARVGTGAYGIAAPKASVSRRPGATPAVPKAAGPGRLLELFWQGAGGINAKNGKLVAQGFVSGHTDHVHVAASTPAAVVRLGRLAQSMGLRVGEQPAFGKVNRVHVTGSNHYSNKAIDVSGSPAKMRAFAHRIAQMYGVG